MPNYPYDDLGLPLDTTNLERLNNNYNQIQSDIQSVSSASAIAVNALETEIDGKLIAQKNELSGRLNVQKTIIDNLVVEGDSSPEAAQARVGVDGTDYPTLKDRIDTEILSKATGAPKGVFATLSALQVAKPSGDGNIYLVTADGKWYYFNGMAWVPGGVYQGIGVPDSSVTAPKVSSSSDLLPDVGIVANKRMLGYWDNQIQYTDDSTSFVTLPVSIPNIGKLVVQIPPSQGTGGQALILTDNANAAIQNFDYNFIYNVANNAQYKDIISYDAGKQQYTILLDQLKAFKPQVAKGVFGFKTGDNAYILANSIKQLDWLNIEKNAAILEIQTKLEEVERKVAIEMPTMYNAVVGREINIYTDNILLCSNPNDFFVDYVCSSASAKQLKECFRFTPSVSDVGDVPVTINVYDNNLDSQKNILLTKTITIKVSQDTALSTPTKAIFIGDSLTNNDIYQREIKNMAGSNFTLLGTRGTAPYLHEGRPSWQANHYTQNASFNGITNAFWNPSTSKFDFAYYMQQQGYTSVDYVSIFLGTNNFYATGAVPFIFEMVNSIKEYSSNVKVTVFTAHLPAADNDGFGKMGGAGQTAWEFSWQSVRFTRSIYETFGNRESEKIYVIPVHINQDRVFDYDTETVNVSNRTPISIKRYTDNVHPSSFGLLKFADVWYGKFKSL